MNHKRWMSLTAALLAILLMIPSIGLGEITDEFANHQFQARKVVGGAVVISRDGEILYETAYGFKNGRRTEPVTLNTCFRIASVTKLVTAVGVVKLCEEQGKDYDMPLEDLMGRRVVSPYYPDEPITLRQVLTHTTGIRPILHYHPNWEILTPNNNDVFDSAIRPGTKYVYSNMNGGLLGGVVEGLSGQSLNTYMKESVFGPLGINAAYHASLLPDGNDISQRLKKNGGVAGTVEKALADADLYEDFCDPGNHTGYSVGGLYISARGLNALLTELCLNARGMESKVLTPGTVAKMMEPQNFEGSSVSTDAEYTLGLARVFNMPGGTWYGHQGRYDGLSANAYFQPDTGLCVTVIANGYDGMAIDHVVSIARKFMEEAQGYLQ